MAQTPIAPPPAPRPATPPPPPVAPQQEPASSPPPAPQPQEWSASAPTAATRRGANRILFVVIGILVIALVGTLGFVAVTTLTSSGSPAGSLNVDPSSFGCPTTTAVRLTVRLPSSVSGSDQVTTRLDGKNWGSVLVSSQFQKQSDGTWLHSGSSSLDTCQGPDGKLSAGTHKLQVVDSHGKLLAEGSFTIN
jgi:hypothetical protein